MEKVSIVIPAFNAESTLEKCINSLIAQTYSNIEIVISDDGSTDHTGVLSDQLAKGDLRIKVIHSANGGVSRARNRAIQAATGTYICFVDSDDWVEPCFVEKLVEGIEKTGADMGMCGWYENDKKYILNGDEMFNSRQMLYYLFSYFEGHYFALWNKIFRKNFLGRFDDNISYLEDGIFICEYLLKTKSACLISEPLYHYVEFGDSLTHSTKLTKQRLSSFNGRQRMIELMACYPDIQKIAKAKYHETVCWVLFSCYKDGDTDVVKPFVKKMSQYRIDFYALKLITVPVKIRYLGYELILLLNLGIKIATFWENLRK